MRHERWWTPSGPRAPNHSPVVLDEIRRLIMAGWTHRAIGEKLGITKNAVSGIAWRKGWKTYARR